MGEELEQLERAGSPDAEDSPALDEAPGPDTRPWSRGTSKSQSPAAAAASQCSAFSIAARCSVARMMTSVWDVITARGFTNCRSPRSTSGAAEVRIDRRRT